MEGRKEGRKQGKKREFKIERDIIFIFFRWD